MLTERLIPFVALDVSASRVQVWQHSRQSVPSGGDSLHCLPHAQHWMQPCAPVCYLMQLPCVLLQEGKKLDLPVYFGDAGSPAVLHAVGADQAACAVRCRAGRPAEMGRC